SAPYLAELLAHPVLRERFRERAALLAATTLSPEQLCPLADSLYTTHAASITFDHERWHSEMPSPHPLEVREELLRFVSGRVWGGAVVSPSAERAGSQLPVRRLLGGQPDN